MGVDPWLLLNSEGAELAVIVAVVRRAWVVHSENRMAELKGHAELTANRIAEIIARAFRS